MEAGTARTRCLFPGRSGSPLLDRGVECVPVLLAGELRQLGALVLGPERVPDGGLAVLALPLVGRLANVGLGYLDLLASLDVVELDCHGISSLVVPEAV